MIIYKATNKINSKIYIGQTGSTLSGRKNGHKSSCYKKEKWNLYFNCVLRKYGLEGFEWEEIDFADSQEELDYMETYWIKFYRSNNKKYGYNLANGGKVNRGFKKTKEQIEQHRKMMKEKYNSGDMVPWNKNKPGCFSKETREKMSKSRKKHPPWNKDVKGIHFSPKTEFKKGQVAWNKGIPFLKETKRKMSESHKKQVNRFCRKVKCIETEQIFDSIEDANKFLNKKQSHIGSVCRKERNECMGLHWEFVIKDKND